MRVTVTDEYRRAVNAARQARHRQRIGRAAVNGLKRRFKSAAYANRPIVAVDGEGVTLDDGSHLYTLLGASDDASIVDPAGLSTGACLDFLLRYAGEFVVSFAFSYDVNMIVGEVKRRQLRRLHDRGFCVTVEHGQRYRIAYTPRKCLCVSLLDGPRTTKSVTVWDTFGFYQTGFVAALRAWKIGTPTDLDYLDGMKRARGDFASVDPADVARYNALECRLLVDLTAALRETVAGAGIRLTRWDGAGALAGAILRQEGIKSHIPDDEPPADVMRGYFGGRIQALELGEIDGPVHNYDINSAYPAACLTLPTLHGRWRQTDRYEPHPYALWRCRWRLADDNGHGSPRRDAPYLTPFPVRAADKSIHYPLVGEGWYWAPLVAFARQHWDFEIVTGHVFDPADDSRPFAFVREMYAQRLVYKQVGDPRHIVLKLGLNSIYGKTAQGIGWRGRAPAYRSYVWAGLITSQTQTWLLAAAMSRPDAVISFATDGIYSRAPLDCATGFEIGRWEEAVYDRMLLFQPGLYVLYQDGQARHRTRGYRPGELDWQAMTNVWRQSGCFGAHDIDVTRFLPLGIALHQKRLDEWRRWVSQSRHVSLRPAAGFPGDSTGPYAIRWLPDYETKGGLESQPYQPKRTQYDIREMLRLNESAEQPDPI